MSNVCFSPSRLLDAPSFSVKGCVSVPPSIRPSIHLFPFLSSFSQLRHKLFSIERERLLVANQSQRRLQIGTRERSDKIRTFNFQQGRVTDHRLGSVNVGKPEVLLQGGIELERLMQNLRDAHRKELLAEMIKDFREGKVV